MAKPPTMRALEVRQQEINALDGGRAEEAEDQRAAVDGVVFGQFLFTNIYFFVDS
jgi:hypothetical protein